MQTDTFGEGTPLVWVMGWGNDVESRHERWFVEQLVEAGWEECVEDVLAILEAR